MPCEGCSAQFSVFRRKRSCIDCKRFYCSNCLSGSKRASPHAIGRCKRCTIFAKRPLLKSDLLTLKPKDLIFYLQSKHISTAGCVEKDELVRLVLHHVQQSDATNTGNNSYNARPSSESTPSFDNIKQTCQNFFSNLTDNITESFSSFDSGKNSKTNNNPNPSGSNAQTHIFDQPRVSTREIPTYASSQQNNTFSTPSPQHSNTEQSSVRNQRNLPTDPVREEQTTSTFSNASGSTDTTTQSSQTNSTSSIASNPTSASTGSAQNHNNVVQSTDQRNIQVQIQSDCECSDDDDNDEDDDDDNEDEDGNENDNDDDELVTTFSERLSNKSENSTQLQNTNCTQKIVEKLNISLPEVEYAHGVKLENLCEADDSSQSSFEELGAIGGISDDSKAATDTNSSHLEQWQILDGQRLNTSAEEPTRSDAEVQDSSTIPTVPIDKSQQPKAPQRTKKVARRRSDTYLNQRTTSGEVVSCPSNEDNESNLFNLHNTRTKCKRCGKTKSNIRRQIAKMRRHLESAQLSEDEIKDELKKFLSYLEARTKSVDYSDSEPATSPASTGLTAAERIGAQFLEDLFAMPHLHDHYDNSDYNSPKRSRFINLEEYGTLKDLECLSVKQLKEVLMLHRVDYKGCCEKQELLERVERLWKNLKSSPAVEKLPTDELCKICMDAPIECVILECGHMATCTNCGKVLSECPICRQYIVRVVRFFRA
ncbi:suppressor of Mek1 [Teleopsis dalmanni]|uniref:suppressor of Mek1 n=1 Tax=Teleopsis dalmanni TaxID=139649 RepID=UPI0018CFC31A|nr:suppressor of Mek1 [Teleopsis dalmanni]XP_037948005.1 suppressor of Mek1 [Teleopsis dalmanni]